MFYDIVIITSLATILAFILWKFKQPSIIAYILVGILIGPNVLNAVTDYAAIQPFSTMGIAFLLFMVGLDLNYRKLRELGKQAVIIGVWQIVANGAICYALSTWLGFSFLSSIYISIALVFSSTVIIIKLLTEQNQLDSLYGRLTIGFLLVQDFFAILILILLGSLNTGGIDVSSLWSVLISGVSLIITAAIFSKYIFPQLFKAVSESRELLFLTSLSWCFIFSYIAHSLGLSIEAGAFIAGISLAPLAFAKEISSRMRPLRDFFIIIFFVLLGLQLQFYPEYLGHIIIFSLFVIIGNPLLLLPVLGYFKLRKRISFFVSLATAQISEFSLIIIALGLALGHVSQEVASIVTSVGIITITVSTYMISFNNRLYNILSPMLSIFERKDVEQDVEKEKDLKNHIILFGYHGMGYSIIRHLKRMKRKIVVVDFDPDVILKGPKQKGIVKIFGDATDEELLFKLRPSDAYMMVSTIPRFDENLFLIQQAKKYKTRIVVTSNHMREALELYKAGADYVLLPYFLGGEKSAHILRGIIKTPKKVRTVKRDHIKFISKKIRLGHAKKGVKHK